MSLLDPLADESKSILDRRKSLICPEDMAASRDEDTIQLKIPVISNGHYPKDSDDENINNTKVSFSILFCLGNLPNLIFIIYIKVYISIYYY